MPEMPGIGEAMAKAYAARGAAVSAATTRPDVARVAPTPAGPDAPSATPRTPEPARPIEQMVRENQEKDTKTIFDRLTARSLHTANEELKKPGVDENRYRDDHPYEDALLDIDTLGKIAAGNPIIGASLNTSPPFYAVDGKTLATIDAVNGNMITCTAQVTDAAGAITTEIIEIGRDQLVNAATIAHRTTIESHFFGDTKELVKTHIDNLARDPSAPEPNADELQATSELIERVAKNEGAGPRLDTPLELARKMLKAQDLPPDADHTNPGLLNFYAQRNTQIAAKLDQIETFIGEQKAQGHVLADEQVLTEVCRVVGFDINTVQNSSAAFGKQADTIGNLIKEARNNKQLINPQTGKKVTKQDIQFWEAQRQDAVTNRDMCEAVAKELGGANPIRQYFQRLNSGQITREMGVNFETALRTGDETAMIRVAYPDYDPSKTVHSTQAAKKIEKAKKIHGWMKKGGYVGLGLSALMALMLMGASREPQ